MNSLCKQTVFVSLLIVSAAIFAADIPVEALPQSRDDNWLNQIDLYSKIFGGVLTGLGTLFGLPLAILHFKKTKAEIKKLEIEAAAIDEAKPQDSRTGIYNINIEGQGNLVKILADPRFLGPLLLLLDFILAWIILTLLGYVSSLFLGGPLRTLLILFVACVLLIPIYREAKRVKASLTPKEHREAT